MVKDHSRPSLSWLVHRIAAQGDEEITVEVVVEEPLEIVLNGTPVATLLRLPGDDKELVAGFCFTEGLVSRFSDVLLLRHCSRAGQSAAQADDSLESRNRVEVTADPDGVPSRADWSRVIRSGCGTIDPGDLGADDLTPVGDAAHVERAVLLGLIATLLAQPRLYRETGGLHAAAIFHTDGRLVAIREDIGRHNAVDKAIGYALLRGIVLDDKLLLTTGRASHEMVTKAVRAGVPVLASVSSPTSLAVQLAQRLNVTLIGYLRGQRMNVYTHRERVDSGA
jgi:FdhD protein